MAVQTKAKGALVFESTALPASIAQPGGRDVRAVIVYGPVPPVGVQALLEVPPIVKVIESGLPGLTTTPVGPETVNVTFCVMDVPSESVTWIPAVKEPVFVGVPETTPVEVFRFNPGGSAPLAIAHTG